MTGYVRKDTTNNIADGNVINAADLDSEFDGVQDAFNASTGHKHDGTAGEGATINALGPTQDVTVSSTLLAPKTTNTVDIGSSALKFKDLFLAGNGSVGGTLAVTGVATFTAQPILSSLTASRAVFSDGSKGLVSNAITGTGNVVMSASPTLTGTVGGASLTLSSLTAGRVTYAGTSGLLQDSANLTFNGTTLTANTLSLTNALATTSGGTGLTSFTSGGVVYASSSSALATGSALTFDGTKLNATALSFSYNTSYYNTDNSISNYSAGNYLYVSGNSGATSGLYLQGAGNQKQAIILDGNASGGNIAFQTNGSEALRLTSTSLYTASGINVGIGLSNPAVRLETSTARSATLTSAIFAASGTGAVNDFNKLTLKVQNTLGGSTGGAGIGAVLEASASNKTGLAFYYDDGSGSQTEGLRLSSAGNLGLGVTPSASWSSLVTQQIGTGGNLFAFKSGNVDKFFMNSNTYYDGSNYIYQSTGFATQYVMDSGIHRWSTAPSGTAAGVVTFTDVLSVDRNKSLALQGASSASGTGITFPATQSASSNANTLDDYEEGTWTPTVTGGYTGVTYNTQNGYYTKIGRLVNLVCYVYFSGTSDASAINVSNLPFQLVGGGNSGTVGYWDVTTDGNLSAWIGGIQNVIFYKVGTSSAAISTGNVTNKFIIFSITGFV